MKIDVSMTAELTVGAFGLGLTCVKALRAAAAKIAIFVVTRKQANNRLWKPA